jgi:predicted enzyme related to lactoylglutathione lyase
MKNYFGRIVILVHDYDEALAFYRQNFDAVVLFDQQAEIGVRFLQIGLSPGDKNGIWFLKAGSREQLERVGDQTGGQPVMVIYTDAIEELYQKLVSNKVHIRIAPVLNPEYSFFHCLDLYGNEIVVVQLKN